MDKNDISRFLLDGFMLKMLMNSYAEIAGLSQGFVSAMMETYGISEKAAQKQLMEIDEIARRKVNESFNQWKKKEEGDDADGRRDQQSNL